MSFRAQAVRVKGQHLINLATTETALDLIMALNKLRINHYGERSEPRVNTIMVAKNAKGGRARGFNNQELSSRERRCLNIKRKIEPYDPAKNGRELLAKFIPSEVARFEKKACNHRGSFEMAEHLMIMKKSLFALAGALLIGVGVSMADGLVIQGSTSSFASQRSFVSSSFKTTPSGIATNLEGNQTSNTGSDSVAFTSTSAPNIAAALDTSGTASVAGQISTQIQAAGTGFAPVNLFGTGSQTAASASRATSSVSSIAVPACQRTCW